MIKSVANNELHIYLKYDVLEEHSDTEEVQLLCIKNDITISVDQ